MLLFLWLSMPLFDTVSQIAMKKASFVLQKFSFGGEWLFQAISNHNLWVSVSCDLASFLIWMGILKRSELSFAYPISSVSYITILIASWYWFGEKIGLLHGIGVGLITIGVVLICWDEKSVIS
ncbi:MAG: EamA family transporter [Candidatus Riflebacteria bacterium]|nr:EamA family transporter [Candidatus Riflebacteria bacterium]